LAARRKFRHCFADIVWIKGGHARVMSGDELSAVRTLCSHARDICWIQYGCGPSTKKDRRWSWTLRGCGLDADKDSLRTWDGCRHSRPRYSHGLGLFADADADMARTRSRAGHGNGRRADADWFRIGRGRGLDKTTANWPGIGAGIPHPNRDYFADAKTLAS
jgi:hypothetical protein